MVHFTEEAVVPLGPYGLVRRGITPTGKDRLVMGIRTKDFACECGKRYPDYPYEGKCPESIPCECGQDATWCFQKINHIHRSISSMYGKMDPRFGVVVESYEHKKQLLKEKGLEELEVERYDDIQNDVAEAQARQAATPGTDNVLIADSLEEINQKISTDQVDRGATGDITRREGADPDSGLMDGWREF